MTIKITVSDDEQFWNELIKLLARRKWTIKDIKREKGGAHSVIVKK